MRIGLRFAKKDRKQLQQLAQEFSGQPGIDPMLYEAAAESARTGEPLIVECTMIAEVRQMAALFGNLGVTPPIITDVSGPGGGARHNGTPMGG